MSPDLDARELHRVITASVRERLETARLEEQARCRPRPAGVSKRRQDLARLLEGRGEAN